MLLAPCLILQFLLQLWVIHSIILLLLLLMLLGDLAAFNDLLRLAQLQDMRFIASVSLSCSSIGWSLASWVACRCSTDTLHFNSSVATTLSMTVACRYLVRGWTGPSPTSVTVYSDSKCLRLFWLTIVKFVWGEWQRSDEVCATAAAATANYWPLVG